MSNSFFGLLRKLGPKVWKEEGHRKSEEKKGEAGIIRKGTGWRNGKESLHGKAASVATKPKKSSSRRAHSVLAITAVLWT